MSAFLAAAAICLALFHPFTVSVCCYRDSLVADEPTTFVARATISIILEFYVPRTSCLAITSAAVLSRRTRYHQASFINEVLNSTRDSIVITSERYPHIAGNWLRSFNLMFVDCYASFRLIYAKMSENRFDFTGIYAVVLTESSSYQYDTITRILQDCWSVHITNVIVLVSIHPQAKTAVYTYFPYTRFHCEAVAPIIINYYLAEGFLYAGIDLFPNKLRNMHGCPMRVAAYQLVPFMILTPLPNGGYHMDGIDGIVMRVQSQRLNFTPIVMVPPNDEGRGSIGMNGSRGTGALGMLQRNEVNLSIGAMAYSARRHQVMTPSFPYLVSALTFAVPKGRRFTAFEKLFLPFRRFIWLSIFAMFVIAAVLFVWLRCVDREWLRFVVGDANRTPFVNMMAVFLGDTMLDAQPTRNFARYVLMVWILGCIVLRTAYQGALFQILQTQKLATPVEMLDELIEMNYSLRMGSELFYLFEYLPKTHPYRRATAYPDNMAEFDELTLRPSFRDAYLTTELTAAYYNMLHKNHTVLVSREQLFNVPFSIYMTKHSPLAESINNQIQLYSVSGLLTNWLTNFYDELTVRGKSRPDDAGDHHPLHVAQVAGAFQICGYMLMLCATVLCLEVMALRFARLQRLFDAI